MYLTMLSAVSGSREINGKLPSQWAATCSSGSVALCIFHTHSQIQHSALLTAISSSSSSSFHCHVNHLIIIMLIVIVFIHYLHHVHHHHHYHHHPLHHSAHHPHRSNTGDRNRFRHRANFLLVSSRSSGSAFFSM